MTLDSILMEIGKLDHIDKQALSAFLIDLVHTTEKFKTEYEEYEEKLKNENPNSSLGT